MAGLYEQFKTDEAKENEGIEVEFPEAMDEVGNIPTFMIAFMGKTNKTYEKAREAVFRPLNRKILMGAVNRSVLEDMNFKLFVSHILKGWKNVVVNGVDLPFSREAATKLLTDLPAVYDRLLEESQLVENFRAASLEECAKN